MYFPDLTPLFKAAAWLLAIFVPLGLWKLIEIGLWLWRHIDINWAA
jgi:hypothetical protein